MKKIVAILMAMIMVISVTVVLAGSAADKDTKTKEPVIIGFESTPGPKDKAIVRGHGGDIKYSYTIINAIAAKLPEPAIENIQKNPRVTYVEIDGEVHTLETELDDSWGVKRIGAGNVHAGGNKGAGVKVAIIDTGIDYTHLDLDVNFDTTLLGYDFVNDDLEPMDDNGHGTHCAGIVAARDNDEGVVGVAPEAYLYAVKVLGSDGRGYLSDVVKGIEWSVDNGMDVISMSLGSDGDSPSLHAACDAAAGGIVIVAAAGNDGNPRGRGDNVDYPARYDSVIAVAATDSNDNRASWSSTGSAVELAAPGVSIKSTYLGGRYAIKSGTSMACPHVAGTAALVIASGEGDVRPCLQQTADDLGAPGKDNLYGYGLVDADEAAHSTGNQAPVADAGADQTALVDETVSFDGSGSYDPDGTIVSYEWDFDYDSTTFTVDASGVDLTNPSHIYDSEGPYTVALRVEDDDGDISSISTATLKVTAPDEQAPVIIDATGDIDGTTGEPVTVSATITDNVGVVSATVHYTPIDGTETTASMIEGASDVWSADVPVDSDKVGTITYYISAQDATPNTARDPTTGTYSITVADKDDPGPIPDLSATAVAGGNVELAWSSVTDNIGVVSYNIYRGSSEITNVTGLKHIATTSGTTYTDTSGTEGTTYYYAVTAVDAVGNEADASNSPSATPDATAPAISGVDSSDVTGTSATIIWTTAEASDSVVNYGATTPIMKSTESNLAMVTSHSVTLTGLAPKTLYYYEVQSTDAAGNTATDNNVGAYYTFTTTAPTNKMHIDSIDMTTTKYRDRGWYTSATATVTVVDSAGALVESATVVGQWSGLTSDTDSEATGSNGEVALYSDFVKSARGTFTFTVETVAKDGWTYEPSGNNENSIDA